MQLWKEPTYHLVETEDELDELVEVLRKAVDKQQPIAIDVETTGAIKKSSLNPYLGWLLGLSVAVSPYEGWYIPLLHTKNKVKREHQLSLELVRSKLNPIVSTGGIFLAHNGKFDYKFLWRSGIFLHPVIWDTMNALRMLNGDSRRPTALKKIIKNYVDIPHSKIIKDFEEAAEGEAAETDPTEFAVYAIDDVIYTYYLYQALKPRIDAIYPDLFYNAEVPMLPILAQMELRGIEIDENYYRRVRVPLAKAKRKIETYFNKAYQVSIGSPAQVGAFLLGLAADSGYDKLGQTKKGAIKTDVEALQTIIRLTRKDTTIHRVAKHVLKYRKIAKTLGTYVDKYPAVSHRHYTDGKEQLLLHTNFSQIKNSGRLSSSPNVQNITKDDSLVSIRRGFVARQGYSFVESDWSGCELRMVAIASQEPRMLKAFRDNPINADLHKLTADEMNITRDLGKTFNFAVIYGATEYSIAKTLNVSKEKAVAYLNKFFQVYPFIKKWKDTVERQVIKLGYSETFYGRRRYITPGLSPSMRDTRDEYKWSGAMRELTNHIIQGTSADLLKYSMTKINLALALAGLDAYLITTTHDSIVAEAKTEIAEEVAAIMKKIMTVTIEGVLLPVDTEIKQSFAKAA